MWNQTTTTSAGQVIDNVSRVAAVPGQKGAKDPDGHLAMAGSGEEHRRLLALHVEEHRDIALTEPRGRLIHAAG